MESKNKTLVVKDFNEKSVLVSREFDAPLALVWRAYTDRNILEQWWAPQPFRAETKTMDFAIGGFWQYAMVGPNGEKHWGRMNYLAIDNHKSINIEDVFCDSEGNTNTDLPTSKGQIVFTETENGTRVDFKTIYTSEAALQTIIEMGFEQGITIQLDQLANLIKENKI